MSISRANEGIYVIMRQAATIILYKTKYNITGCV